MTIKTEINRLEIAKTNIRNEIGKLGVSIPSTAKLDTYPTYINQYVLDFNSRLSKLEQNSQKALYFGGSVTFKNGSTEERLETQENLEELKLYIK